MLKDLHELTASSKQNIQEELHKVEGEIKFPVSLRGRISALYPESTCYSSYAVIPTSTKTVIAPSVWFFVGGLLVPLLEELLRYKRIAFEAWEQTRLEGEEFDKWADEVRKRTILPSVEFKNFLRDKYGQEDLDKVVTFVTDYSSWGGGKSIGRTQDDFFHSALLKVSGLLNESSGYLSSITYKLMENPQLIPDILDQAHLTQASEPVENADFVTELFIQSLTTAELIVPTSVTYRFVSSLLAKRFLILTGLSGSGKTKLAQAFVRWISANEEQYLILPVAADWTNREPLFGYPDALNKGQYVKPESGVLDLILRAQAKENIPHFLILDEMNLSHVERYFADFLSGLESDEDIPLHSSNEGLKALTEEEGDGIIIPAKIMLPKNLFIIGTVNIDETTYMFSPKVLDRANVIEFRVSATEISDFLDNPVKPDLKKLDNEGRAMGASFASMASVEKLPYKEVAELNKELISFFNQLKLSGAEFGYRTAHEIHRLAGALQTLNPKISVNEVIDVCIMQKLLPKVHGSRKKMVDILKEMARFCVEDGSKIETFLDEKEYKQPTDVKYPMSLEKLHRMYRGAIENGFTSFAEA